MKIFRSLIIIPVIACASVASSAFTGQVSLVDAKVEHTATMLVASATVDASSLKISSNEEVLVKPVIVFADGSEIALQQVSFAGHNRRVQALRMPSQYEGVTLSTPGASVEVSASVPFEPAMADGHLMARVYLRGCVRCPQQQWDVEGSEFAFHDTWKFKPSFVFVTPQAEESKMRRIDGRAFIDFRVNRTEIDPQYRNNPRELGVIYATIDSVMSDPDVSVKHMSFTGYASPEGSYAANARLAQGRTEALKNFVKSLYDVPESLISVSSVPEDWDGLVKALEKSDFAAKEAILAVARDHSLAPDDRDRALARRFPSEYKAILADIYPTLRHSDYTINYEVAHFDDPAVILQLIETAPRKLSLREMFVAANTLTPGSEEYCRVFETAARLHPDSEVANLNAAVSELQRGSLDQARYFLDRAGNSAMATYTRGLLAAFDGRYTEARVLLTTALDAGVTEAQSALEQIKNK